MDAEDVIVGAFNKINPIVALTEMADCIGMMLRDEPWDGRIWFGALCDQPVLREKYPLRQPLLEFVPERKCRILQIKGQSLMVRHIPEIDCGGGDIPHHIRLSWLPAPIEVK